MKAKQAATNSFFIFCIVMLTACGPSKEQVAATMAVQANQARATGKNNSRKIQYGGKSKSST